MYACVLVYCDVAYCIHNDQNCQLLPSVPSRLSVIKTWHLCGECECVTFTACAFCHFIHAIECVVEHLYIYIAKTSICAVCALWLVRVEAFRWNDLISRPGQDTTTNQQQRQSRTATTTKKNHAVKEKRATELRLSEWRRPHRAHANTHRHTFGDTTKAEKSGYKWFIVAKTANSHNFYILENKKEWLDCWSLYIAHENTFVYCLTNVSYSMLYTIMNYLECWPWGGPTHSAFPNGQNESKKGGLADREMASFIQIISAHTNAASTRQHHKCEDKTSRLCVSIGKPVKHFALHCTIHFNIWIYYRIYGETRQKKQ